MGQLRQHPALLQEAGADASAAADQWQLQRHRPLVGVVGALRQPDVGHATMADQSEQLVRADQITHRMVIGQGLGQAQIKLGLALQVVAALNGLAVVQQLLQARPQWHIMGRQGMQPSRALCRW